MEILDVRGLSCPIPVMKTKKALDKGLTELEITGDSQVSRENVSKYAVSQGFTVKMVSYSPNEWKMAISK